MQIIQINGGAPLEGVVSVHGAKNAVLPILAATAVYRGQYILRNCPNLRDVQNTLAILRHLGCCVQQDGDVVYVDSRGLCRCDIPVHLMQTMRSSVLFLGALSASCMQAEICLPGGCRLGSRPVNLHLEALRAMGAEISAADSCLCCDASVLHGAAITLTYPSVGATENIMLASMGAKGTVTLYNAAKEPEIEDLAGFLRTMGAKITGAGTAVIQMEGNQSLHDASYTIMPDRIEAATYLCAAAACGGDVTLQGIDLPHLYAVVEMLMSAGVQISGGPGSLRVRAGRLRAPKPICTAPYPGFPTDAQPLAMAALLKAEGITLIEEKIFENRLRHTAAMCAMGADIQVANRIARIRGVSKLRGACVEAADLRAAAGLVIAALSAEGQSRIGGVEYLLRGYENLDENLRRLGGAVQFETLP